MFLILSVHVSSFPNYAVCLEHMLNHSKHWTIIVLILNAIVFLTSNKNLVKIHKLVWCTYEHFLFRPKKHLKTFDSRSSLFPVEEKLAEVTLMNKKGDK